MAKLVATTRFDMQAFLLDGTLQSFFQDATSSGTSTRVFFNDTFDGITEQLTLSGSFGNYVNGLPMTGTITRAQYSITGGEAFTISGFTMSVAQFTNFVQTNDALGLFDAVLGGNDAIFGSSADDFLLGFGGNDTMNGRLGADQMAGMTGDDRYNVDNAGDIVAELAGEGTDTVISRINYTLTPDVEILRLDGAAISGTGNDLANEIIGSGADNTLRGMDGNDILRGLTGQDTLIGGTGHDTLDGGARKDTLTGNSGADLFIFSQGDTQATRGTADVITDFNRLQSDEIHLGGIDANSTLDGNQRFTWVADGAFTGVAGQLRYAHANGMTYVEGDTNGDSIADVIIALNGTIELTAADFTF